MAIARLSVGTGSKGKAGPHAQYIAREGKYAKPSDDLEKLEFTGHGNMPRWAESEPNYFWRMADEHERKNGSTYREHVIALPRELTADQRHELILDWIAQEIGDKHAYQYAIHNPPALDGGEQPHAHIMFSERTRDGIERDPDQYFKRYNPKNPTKGGAKKANTGLAHTERKSELVAQRDRWEQVCNAHLESAGSDARISMKTLAAQGIDREPVNLTMRQFKIPAVIDTYKQWLDAKAQYKKALEEQESIDVVAELERLAEQSQTPAYEWIVDAVERINDGE
ncbi:MobA/MobL family protein, partial [Psychrobacter immobilis]|uniref:MobA/MobL family protein n=1 Tax=Psychrobacter immobilis TaxID=498 RepID=UPI003FD62BF4